MSELTKRYAILRNREKNPSIFVEINGIGISLSRGDIISAGADEINNGDIEYWVRVIRKGKETLYTR